LLQQTEGVCVVPIFHGLSLNKIFSSLCHRWSDPKLVNHAEVIIIAPVFYELSVGETHDVNPGHCHLLASGGNAEELALVGAVHRDTDRHFVALGDRFLVLPMQVWESGTQNGDDLFVALQSVLQAGRVRVVDEIAGHDFVCHPGSCNPVPLVQILIKKAADEGFVVFD